MGIAMPAPILIGSTYYLKIRVPADLKHIAKDRSFSFEIDGRTKTVKLSEFAKVSLETGDRQKAKERFTVAHASLLSFWDALRNGLPRLTFKQSVAVAGEIRDSFLAAFDEEPATAELWERVARANRAAASGRLSSLRIDTTHNIKSDMEARFGPLADLWIAKKGVEVLEKDRHRLLAVIAEALTDSRDVAAYFDKRHDNVLRDIEALIGAAPECSLNFEETSNEVLMPRGGTRFERAFDMTRTGFTLLAMGFTGAKALVLRLGFRSIGGDAPKSPSGGDCPSVRRSDCTKIDGDAIK